MTDQLHVSGTNGSAEVAHGDRCVVITIADEDGAFTGGLVLDPAGARRLADLLAEQAFFSEKVR